MNCFKKHKTNHNGSAWIYFPSDPNGHIQQYDIITFRNFRLSSPGSRLESNLGNIATPTPPSDTTTKMLFAGTRP